MENQKEKLSASELQLGDTVSNNSCDGWDTCIVISVSDEAVELWRPYGTTADFSMSWGRGGPDGSAVIPYIGTETWKESRRFGDSHRPFTLLRRQALK